MNSAIQKLSEFFEKLPGIGPRQARRFVYALLSKNQDFLENFSSLILNLKKNVSQCEKCNRFFQNQETKNLCELCSKPGKDKKILLVVEKDVDLENIEKAGFFNGFYFVLGGLVPPIGSSMPKEIKMKELFERIKKDVQSKDLEEIILAFSATAEGENTMRYIEKILEPITEKRPIKINRLGRGLSTGTELEYSDKETIVSAFKSRR